MTRRGTRWRQKSNLALALFWQGNEALAWGDEAAMWCGREVGGGARWHGAWDGGGRQRRHRCGGAMKRARNETGWTAGLVRTILRTKMQKRHRDKNYGTEGVQSYIGMEGVAWKEGTAKLVLSSLFRHQL